MGLKEVQEYATKLKKVEKMKEIREQVSVPSPSSCNRELMSLLDVCSLGSGRNLWCLDT